MSIVVFSILMLHLTLVYGILMRMDFLTSKNLVRFVALALTHLMQILMEMDWETKLKH